MITTQDSNIGPSKIELLPEHIIDQIKAGEVLERPASLIKELIENSIDAKSTDINLQIIDNGLELISIEDNGIGMTFDNLPYAFLRHATSKLKTFDDLFRLHSFGFRGEALASIAACARVTCQTQPLNLNLEGGKLIINGGVEELLVPMKNPRHGTSIYIKNLFYNTPARLKFVKSKTSERIQLKKIISSFLISNPHIGFSIKWDDKEKDVYKALPLDDYKSRFSQLVFGKNKETTPILMASNSYDGHTVSVMFTLDAQKNSPNKHQFLFANNRLFFDKSLHQAIIRNTDSIWKYGESGHYFISITTPTEEIDVNVHPNKTQIKFLKNDVIYSLLVTSIKDALKDYYGTQKEIVTEQSANHFEEVSFIPSYEEERHSLFELRDRSFDARVIPSSMTQISVPQTEQNTDQSFIQISNNYFIFKYENETYLAAVDQLFTNYVLQLVQEAQSAEENISPLLISEPFQSKLDHPEKMQWLKKSGFEFDRLNSEVIVLRTIPKKIHRDLIKPTTQLLLSYIEQTKSPMTKDSLIQFIKQKKIDLNLNPQLIYAIYKNNPQGLIANSKKLTDDSMAKLFNE